MKTINSVVVAALLACTVEDKGRHVVVTPPEVSQPNDYFALKEFLENLEGEYQSGRRNFVFDYNPEAAIREYADKGEMPPANPFAYFPTPESLARDAVARVGLRHFVEERGLSGLAILEPSAGRGRIAAAICAHLEVTPDALQGVRLDLVEFDPMNCERLRRAGFQPDEADFLEWENLVKYDVVVMNPPFSTPGRQDTYIEHVLHAFSMLKPDGVLVAIVPPNYEMGSKKRQTAFREFVAKHGKVFKNAPGAFKESGTNAKTYTIVFGKAVLPPPPTREFIDKIPSGNVWSIGAGDKVRELICLKPDGERDCAMYYVVDKGILCWTGAEPKVATTLPPIYFQKKEPVAV